MNIVVYKNISEEDIKNYYMDGFEYHEYDNDEILDEAALFLISEKNEKIIPTIQHVCKKNPEIGIIVIPDNPYNNNQLKISIQFAPFINNYIKVSDSLEVKEIKDAIQKEAALTKTRINFKKRREHSNKAFKGFVPDVNLKATFLDKFLAQAPIGAVLLDEKNKILDVNNYVRNLIEGSGAMVSSPIFTLFPDQKSKINKLLKSDQNKDEGITLEIKSKVAQSLYLEIFISHIEAANTSYKMLMMLDVTNEVRSEEMSQEYLTQLENHNKELEQFAYIVSHDLKNPLSTIMLSCEMSETATPEEMDNYMKIIKRSSKNLLQMIQGLETMIDVRKTREDKYSHIEFQEILNNIISEYQFQIEYEKIQILADFKITSIEYVPSYLHSIFHNIISNAIKYRKHEEELVVKISTEKSGGYTLVKFEDNGIGIDLDQHKKHLFQPFRRFTDQAHGRGIGLNIIKSMIEKNNGKIDVESTLGKGTTFFCYLCPYS